MNIGRVATLASCSPRASTPERILDAFQDLVIDSGERAATLNAIAQHASVSKGGLLYHFGSKASY